MVYVALIIKAFDHDAPWISNYFLFENHQTQLVEKSKFIHIQQYSSVLKEAQLGRQSTHIQAIVLKIWLTQKKFGRCDPIMTISEE